MHAQLVKVLLIEADCRDAEQVARVLLLSDTEYQLRQTADLATALDALRDETFDLVLADVAEDGVERLRRIREAAPQVPVVVLAAVNSDGAAIRLLDQGAQDYLIKSRLTTEVLDRSVRYAILRQQNYDEIRRRLAENESRDEQLRRKNRRLSKLCATAQKFVDNVSHEFRTPLTVVKEYTSLLHEGLVGEVNDEQRRMLQIVEDRADDLNIMVDDMLDVSKLEAGVLGAWRKACRCEDALERVRSSLERKATLKGVSLAFRIESPLPIVYCDAEKTGRIVTNLAINAIKFCGEPGRVEIWAKSGGPEDVVIGVTDNGPGIPPESLSVIFERFKQLVPNPRRSTKGFGLGLNIAHEMVDLGFGEMNVRSELGQGSTFSFTLPVAEPRVVVSRYLARRQRKLLRSHGRQTVDVPTVGVQASGDAHGLATEATGKQRPGRAAALSLVTTRIGESASASLADDMDAFLNFLLRRNDLLFRLTARSWLIVLPTPAARLDAYLARVKRALQDANRNRPFGPLPEPELAAVGTWSVPGEVDELLQEVAASCRPAGVPTRPATSGHAVGVPEISDWQVPLYRGQLV